MTSTAKALTPLDHLLTGGEDARLEIVDGELSAVETSGEHADAQLGVGAAVRAVYHRRSDDEGRRGGWWIYVEPTILLSIRDVYRPDLAGWRRERLPERPTGFPIRDTPDWVCEVLSPGNAERDLTHKRRAYHAAKVGYYWIVDPMREEITVLRWSLDGYTIVEVDPVDGALHIPPFEAAPIVPGSLFGKE